MQKFPFAVLYSRFNSFWFVVHLFEFVFLLHFSYIASPAAGARAPVCANVLNQRQQKKKTKTKIPVSILQITDTHKPNINEYYDMIFFCWLQQAVCYLLHFVSVFVNVITERVAFRSLSCWFLTYLSTYVLFTHTSIWNILICVIICFWMGFRQCVHSVVLFMRCYARLDIRFNYVQVIERNIYILLRKKHLCKLTSRWIAETWRLKNIEKFCFRK